MNDKPKPAGVEVCELGPFELGQSVDLARMYCWTPFERPARRCTSCGALGVVSRKRLGHHYNPIDLEHCAACTLEHDHG